MSAILILLGVSMITIEYTDATQPPIVAKMWYSGKFNINVLQSFN